MRHCHSRGVALKKDTYRGLAVDTLTSLIAAGLTTLGFQARADNWFDTLTFDLDEKSADAIYLRAVESGINLRRIGKCGKFCIRLLIISIL